jgi:proline iminopeptidase
MGLVATSHEEGTDTMMRHSLLLIRLAFGLASLPFALAGCLDPDDPGNLVPKTVVEDPSLPRIEVAGALMHAEAFGPAVAPTVIVLHGGPGVDYRSLLPLRALADDGYRVQFWDQRGAGLSQRFDAASYTFAGYLEDLRLVVEQTVAPGQPFAFIGHSWGAMYATWFINEYGDYGGRLRGAVLSDPGGFTKAELDSFIADYTSSFDLAGEQLNDAFWAEQFMSAADHARADYLRGIIQLGGVPAEHADPANPAPFWRAGAVVNSALFDLAKEQGFDWTTHLAGFGHKVLFLRGDLDTAHTEAQQRALAAHFPVAEIVTMNGVGHLQSWERPAEYIAHTRAYFNAIGFVGGAQ